MKVIDVLNKIANGEEVPMKIKWGVHNLTWCVNEYIAFDELGNPSFFEIEPHLTKDFLNDEVEIIEEPKEIPEKLKDILRVDDLIPPVDENMYKIWTQTIKNYNKINEILDYLKED